MLRICSTLSSLASTYDFTTTRTTASDYQSKRLQIIDSPNQQTESTESVEKCDPKAHSYQSTLSH